MTASAFFDARFGAVEGTIMGVRYRDRHSCHPTLNSHNDQPSPDTLQAPPTGRSQLVWRQSSERSRSAARPWRTPQRASWHPSLCLSDRSGVRTRKDLYGAEARTSPGEREAIIQRACSKCLERQKAASLWSIHGDPSFCCC